MATAGDIMKEFDLHVIKNVSSTDAAAASNPFTRGQVVCWDKSNNDGFMLATNTSAGPFGVALDTVTDKAQTVRILESGVVWVKKVTGQALHAKEWVEVSSTAGSVTIFDYSSGTFKEIVGTVIEDAAAADTEVLIRLGF